MVAIKLPPTLIMELGPKKNPLAFARMTVPLAARCPQICDGAVPPIVLRTTELDEGCRNRVVSLDEISKLPQFMGPHTADNAVRPGRYLRKRRILNDWHNAFLGRYWFTMWTSCWMIGEVVHAILDLLVYSLLKYIG